MAEEGGRVGVLAVYVNIEQYEIERDYFFRYISRRLLTFRISMILIPSSIA